MQRRRKCSTIGLGFIFISLVSGCGDGDRYSPVYGGPPSEDLVADGTGPSGLIQGRDGMLYGMTGSGGQFNLGTVFSLTPDGKETVLYSFQGGDTDGANPVGALIQGGDGSLYGATAGGGPGACPGPEPVDYDGPPASCGTIVKLTPSGAETVLHFFGGGADGGQPTGSLVQGKDGNFYGSTSYGTGTVFAITPQGTHTVLYSFPNYTADGSIPSSLILGSDGNFYGTTFAGGSADLGTVFRMFPAGAETVLYSFTGDSDGETPSASLIEGSDGNFYGTTPFGGGSGEGTIFRISPAGHETVLFSFPRGTSNGENPFTALVQGDNGNYYGSTQAGGNVNNDPCGDGCGSLFELAPTGNETAVYLFPASTLDGVSPSGSLLQGSDGNFYGTTSGGGQFGGGTIFQITPTGALTVLHSFGSRANSL